MGMGSNLFIDKVVIEANLGGIFAIVAIVDTVETGPIDRTQTHGTGLARGVDFAAFKVVGVQLTGCLTDTVHFGMSRRVIVDRHCVRCLSND